MTAYEFRRIINSETAKFEKMWQDGSRKHPDSFPSDMDYGDWFEQFIIFSSEEETE